MTRFKYFHIVIVQAPGSGVPASTSYGIGHLDNLVLNIKERQSDGWRCGDFRMDKVSILNIFENTLIHKCIWQI